MSIITFTYKEYATARAFLHGDCSNDEITTLLEGGVITLEEGDSVYDAGFEGSDQELIESILENRTKKYTLQFIDNKHDGYFIVGKL